jgi:hypothetical protein
MDPGRDADAQPAGAAEAGPTEPGATQNSKPPASIPAVRGDRHARKRRIRRARILDSEDTAPDVANLRDLNGISPQTTLTADEHKDRNLLGAADRSCRGGSRRGLLIRQGMLVVLST